MNKTRCSECILWKPHYQGGKPYYHLNRKEYTGVYDRVKCAVVRDTHVNTLPPPCNSVTNLQDPRIQEVVSALRTELDHIGRRAMGLAANQLGYDLTIAVIRYPNAAEYHRELVLINPKLECYSKDLVHWVAEGCLSIGNGFKPYPAPRSSEITVSYYDEGGNFYRIDMSHKSDGDLCWAVQHEIDHLNHITVRNYQNAAILPEEARTRWELATARSEQLRKIQHTPVKSEKIGRNQPCPCNSGRKYKHCCGRGR